MRPAFLVDGITEQRFIQRVCPGRPVKLINLNGSSVKTLALAKRVASLIRIWKGRCHPIVVIVDREDRDASFEEFADSLLVSIREEGITDSVIVGVADRMIENWMLGDPVLWPGHAVIDCVDGFSGATLVKRQLPTYDKAANGPSILAASRASEIANRSPSFSSFSHKLGNIRCFWMGR